MTAFRGSFAHHSEVLILWLFCLLQGTLEEHFRLGANAIKIYYAQKKDITVAEVVPRGSLDASLLQVLGKYKEFNIFFPITGQHQRYGYKNALCSLFC